MIYRVFRYYNHLLHTYPLVTQCLTTGALLGAGDVITQTVFEPSKPINWMRTTKFGALGCCFIGPVLRYWFIFLEVKFGSTGKYTPLKKVLIDQSLFAPCLQFVNIPIFGLMNLHSWTQIKKKIEKDYADIMIANWKVWPFVQLFNFYLIPLNYRLPFVCVIALFWNIYYTWKMGDESHDNKE